MNTSHELEDEIRRELGKLHQLVTRQVQIDTKPNEVQQTMDYFLIDWCNQLIIEEQAELRGSRRGVEVANANAGRDNEKHDRSDSIEQASGEAELAIKERFSELRLGLINAIQDIEKGRAPNFLPRQSFNDLVRSNQHNSGPKP